MVTHHSRILAVDIRSSWLGYAVFEERAKLLDFGVTRVKSRRVGVHRVAALLEGTHPTLLVLRKVGHPSRRNQPRMRIFMRFTLQEASRLAIEVAFVGEKDLYDCFNAHGAHTKQKIATLLATMLSELTSRLPPPRKTWQHEHWNMPIFDAAALGVGYLYLVGDVTVREKLATTGIFTPVLAKDSKSFSLIDCISAGVDRMQRNFEPMRRQVKAWQRSELTDVTAKVVIYEAFVEGKLEAPKHLARTVHDLYFEPKYEEFRSRTIWNLSNAFTSAFKELEPIPQLRATASDHDRERVSFPTTAPSLVTPMLRHRTARSTPAMPLAIHMDQFGNLTGAFPETLCKLPPPTEG